MRPVEGLVGFLARRTDVLGIRTTSNFASGGIREIPPAETTSPAHDSMVFWMTHPFALDLAACVETNS
jgi:hypothetical protein